MGRQMGNIDQALVSSGVEASQALLASSDTLTIGVSTGGVNNTLCKTTVLSWPDLVGRVKQTEVGTKNGSYFVRCALKQERRSDENALLGNLLILDGDKSLVLDTGELKEGAPNPIYVHEVLRDLDIKHCIYTSHSNRKDFHKFRAVIPVEIDGTDELKALVAWTIHKLNSAGVGLANVQENTTFTQPWFFPRADKGNLEHFQFFEHDGGEVFPKSEAMLWWAENKPVDLPAKAVDESRSYGADTPIGKFNAERDAAWFIELLRQNGYKFDSQTVINNSPAYRFICPKSTSGMAGVVLFMTKKGVWRVYSHHGASDPLSGFAHDAFGLATIFDYGGDEDQALESIGVFRREIMVEEVLASDVDTEHGQNLVEAYAKQLRKDFNLRHGAVVVEGKFVVVYREKVNNVVQQQLATTDAMLNFYAHKRLPHIAADERTGIKVLEWGANVFADWKTSHFRRTYSTVEFCPEPRLVASEQMPTISRPLNLYLGSRFAPIKGNCDIILKHIGEVWCSGDIEVYEYIIKWLANMIQRPFEQGKTVLVLRSGEGTGKNIIIDMIARYYGRHAALLTNPSELVGFNDHLGTAVLVFLNEALFGGDKAIQGTLKAIVTDDQMLIERKYLPKFPVKNCTHIIAATNNSWAVPVGLDDRRFVFIEVDGSKRGDHAYFDSLSHEIHNGGQEAFIYHLLNEVDLKDFRPQEMPEGIAKSQDLKFDHKVRTLGSIEQYLIRVLQDGGYYPPKEDKAPDFVEWDTDREFEVLKKELFDSYLESSKGKYSETMTSFRKILMEMLQIDDLRMIRRCIDGKARRWVLPSLTDARASIEEKYRTQIKWEEAESLD